MSERRTPTSFTHLNKDELVAAVEYFGSLEPGVEAGDLNKESLKAALVEDGVTWKVYAEAFNLDVPKDEPDEEEDNIVRSENVTKPKEDNVAEVVTQDPSPALKPSDKYLVKMTRKNPYFEFRRYKFTQDNPYAIMTADDAQAILQNEDGFRQAFPAELQEFYG